MPRGKGHFKKQPQPQPQLQPQQNDPASILDQSLPRIYHSRQSQYQMEFNALPSMQPPSLPSHHTQAEQSSPSASTSQPNLSQPPTDTNDGDVRRTRGPTTCPQVSKRADGIRHYIRTNEFGQPDGENAPQFSSHLGTLARKGNLLPICHSDWRHVPTKKKEDIWKLVLDKWDIEPYAKKWVISSLGAKWRDWKGELKRKYYQPYKTNVEQVANMTDTRVILDQWHQLIEIWNSEASKIRSEKNKTSRNMQKMGHTAGSRSFAQVKARMREKMANAKEPTRAEVFIETHKHKDGTPVDLEMTEKIAELERLINLQSNSEENVNPNDVFSQVFGKEKHGHVRTYGLGVSPADLWGKNSGSVENTKMQIDTANEIHKLKEELQSIRQENTDVKVQLADLKALMESMQGRQTKAGLHTTASHIRQDIDASSDNDETPIQNNSSSSNHHVVTSYQGMSKRARLQRSISIEIGSEVLLKSYKFPHKPIARGVLLSKDPLTMVGKDVLGYQFWKVQVNVACIPRELLIRPQDRLKRIADAVGYSIAWPSTYVALAED